MYKCCKYIFQMLFKCSLYVFVNIPQRGRHRNKDLAQQALLLGTDGHESRILKMNLEQLYILILSHLMNFSSPLIYKHEFLCQLIGRQLEGRNQVETMWIQKKPSNTSLHRWNMKVSLVHNPMDFTLHFHNRYRSNSLNATKYIKCNTFPNV